MTGPVFLFPGQGSQYVGMGKALFDAHDSIKKLFDEASAVAGRDLRALCFEGPEATLVQTDNVQPAITLVSLACLQVLRDEMGIEAGAVAGHSLGEYAALHAAGAMSFTDTMSVVQTRGAAMRAEAERHPGSMAAIFSLAPEAVAAVCDEVGADQVQVANMNAPGQVAITGTIEGVQQAGKLAKAKGAKLVVPLKVSGPWHSRFMAGAQGPVAAALERAAIAAPRLPCLANSTAEPYGDDPQEIRRTLVAQLVRPVLWTQSMSRLVGQGFRTFIEVGPGRVLSGLLKDVSRDLTVLNVQDADSLAKVKTVYKPASA